MARRAARQKLKRLLAVLRLCRKSNNNKSRYHLLSISSNNSYNNNFNSNNNKFNITNNNNLECCRKKMRYQSIEHINRSTNTCCSNMFPNICSFAHQQQSNNKYAHIVIAAVAQEKSQQPTAQHIRCCSLG